MKYARLTKEQLEELHPEFTNFLATQSIDKKEWDELKANTEILSSTSTNPNLWHDTIWKYLSFLDPEKAIELYNSYPNRIMKFGVSDAQTYHWLHAMNVLGNVDVMLMMLMYAPEAMLK